MGHSHIQNLDDWSNMLYKIRAEKDQDEVIEDINIDLMLDEYNDYQALYKMFGDKKYKDKADSIMETIYSLSNQ